MAGPRVRLQAGLLALTFLSSGARPSLAADAVWRFGTVEAKGDAGLLYMPVQFGHKYGVNIEMSDFASSTTPVKALLGGDLDAFTASPGVALVAMSQGADLKFVGCNWPGATYALYGAAEIKTLKDLAGKDVGVSGPGSMPDLFAQEVLSNGGVKLDDLRFANAGGGSDRFRALLAGVVQATATSTEFEPEAGKRGINVLVRAHDALPNFARNCIVTTGREIARSGPLLAAFLAATMDGIAYALSHRDETLALTRKIVGLAPEEPGPAFIYDEAVRQHDLDPTLAIPEARLQWMDDMLARHAVVDARQAVAKFIDEKPRQDAIKQLKP